MDWPAGLRTATSTKSSVKAVEISQFLPAFHRFIVASGIFILALGAHLMFFSLGMMFYRETLSNLNPNAQAQLSGTPSV